MPQTEHVQAILNLGSTAKRVELEFGTHQHQTDSEAVGLAKELIDAESGRLEPEKMRDKYAETLRELLGADWSAEFDEAWRVLLAEIEGVVAHDTASP